MPQKIIAINGSPRKGWNTDTLVQEAAAGAASKGAETEVVHLYDMQSSSSQSGGSISVALPFTGCLSCFGCKMEPHIGKCVLKDGLAPTLEKIRAADGLIIGSPIYINEVTANIRALVERLTFQYISYKLDPPQYNTRRIPVTLIFTSGCPEAAYEQVGYTQLFRGYEERFERFIGPTNVMWSSNAWQVKDYDKFGWTMFDVADRRKHREEVFPLDRKKAFDLGAGLVEEI